MKKEKCSLCNKNSVGFIRTKPVCKNHLNEFKEDNVKRMKLGIKLPKKLVLLNEEK